MNNFPEINVGVDVAKAHLDVAFDSTNTVTRRSRIGTHVALHGHARRDAT